MQSTMTRSLIETLVRSKLNSLMAAPERTVRNLVDMALHFSTGRFQKHFFEIAQNILNDDNSPYYQLIHHMVAHVDTERLFTFGMNIGYNSFTYGAKIIRKIENEANFNIPWSITLELGKNLPIHQLINEGKAIGIYTWHLISSGHLEDILPIIEMNRDCAFFIYCKPEELKEKILDIYSNNYHVMFVVEYDETNLEIYSELQRRKFLYSSYLCYDEKMIPSIINDDSLCSINETNSLFVILFADCSTPLASQHMVFEYTQNSIKTPHYKTLPFEFMHDNEKIDSIISEDACNVWFDSNGTLQNSNVNKNYTSSLLYDLLRCTFPKK